MDENQNGSSEKSDLIAAYDTIADTRSDWIAKNAYFYEEDCRYLRFLVPAGLIPRVTAAVVPPAIHPMAATP